MMPIFSVRRHCARYFRSVPRDVLLLIIGVVITLTLVVRQYNSRFNGDYDVHVQNPLREISLHPEDDEGTHVEHRGDDDLHHRAPEKHIPEVVVKHSKNDLVTIDPRIRRIGDYLSDICRESQEEVSVDTAVVSIIVHFTDYEFYDIRNTIDSCLRINSDDEQLVQEVIVVDDGSTLDYVIDDARRYFKSIQKITLLRHDPSSSESGNNGGDRLGPANARLAGATRATGDVLVFLSQAVICSPGWLQPLVTAATEHRNSIVAPHLDRIRDPVSLEYQKTSDWLVGHVSWDLAIRMREVPPPSTSADDNGNGRPDVETDGKVTRKPPMAPKYIQSAAIRGDAFATMREFFFKVGGFDPHLSAEASNGGAGEQVELGMRTWLCGGSIITATCSRVGVINLHDPIKVTDSGLAQYVASLWFGDLHAVVMQMYRTRSNSANNNAAASKRPPRKRQIAFCDRTVPDDQRRDINWFLSNVARDMVKPMDGALAFGLLRVKTGRCGRLLPDSMRVLLENCRPQLYGRPADDMVFQLTQEGYLTIKGKCLTVQNNAYIVAKDCQKDETHQLFKYRWSKGQLVNVWCHYCVSHVTDPDLKTPGDRQIMMAQKCSEDTTPDAQFTTWEFIAL